MEKFNIGVNIKTIMEKLRISPVELASKLGFTREAVYSILRKEDINTKLLQNIADALGVGITEFFGESISEYNAMKIKYEALDILLRSKKNQNEKLFIMIHELIHFVLSNTYYNELVENYVKATEYGSLQMDIAQSISSYKPHKGGYYIPFDHDTVSRIINSVLFEYPAIATAFEKKKIKNELLIKQYQEWKDNPPSYPEKD